MNSVVLAITVALSGGAGAALRLTVDSAIARRWRHEIATGTLVINVVGSLLAGIIVGEFLAHGLSPTVKTIVVTGFCGGLTTWSAAMVEAQRLVRAGWPIHAVVFGAGGCALSIAAAVIGLVVTGA